MNEVVVYVLHTSLVKDNYSFAMSKLDKKRIDKALRFVQEKDRLLSIGAGYLLNKYLPHEEMKFTDKGKPYLDDGPYFNLSHSGEYVVLAIDNSRDVGVDIERIDETKIDAIKFSLSEEEKDIVDLNTLFLIWSNKESYIKCLSSDIGDIKTVKGLPTEGVRYECFTKSMIYNNYSLSITLKGAEPFNLKIKSINSLKE